MGRIKITGIAVSRWFIVVLLVSGISAHLLAYVWVSVTIPFEVKEPLEILDYTSELSLFPGETQEINVTLQNHASITYSVVFDYRLNDSSYQSDFVRFSDETYNVSSGVQTLTAWLFVEPNAPPTQALLTINFLRAEPVTPAIVIYPSDDSYVKRQRYSGGVWTDTSDWNYGDSPALIVCTTTVDDREGRTFLKFSLSSIHSPEDIDSVRLFLFKSGEYPSGWGGVGSVEAREVIDDSWTEESITWNNQPAFGGLLDTTYIVFGSSQWYSWDVTPFVLDELAGDEVASICLKAENEDGGSIRRWSKFWSKEYDDFDPYLQVSRHARASIFSQNFDEEPTGSVPQGWIVENPDICSLTVNETIHYGDSGKSARYADSASRKPNGSSYVARTFDAPFTDQNGILIAEFSMMAEVPSYFSLYIDDGIMKYHGVNIYFTPYGRLAYYDDFGWHYLCQFSIDTWVRIKMVIDILKNTYDIYADGVLEAEGAHFRGFGTVTQLSRMLFGGNSFEMPIGYIDEIFLCARKS